MYNNLSKYCHMPVSHQVPLQSPAKAALTQQVEDRDFGRVGVESCCELRVDVERRVERCCKTGLSLQNACGGGKGVPAGRSTEDIVGRDTGGRTKNNDNNNDDEHQRHTNDNRKDLGFEESVSEELFSQGG